LPDGGYFKARRSLENVWASVFCVGSFEQKTLLHGLSAVAAIVLVQEVAGLLMRPYCKYVARKIVKCVRPPNVGDLEKPCN